MTPIDQFQPRITVAEHTAAVARVNLARTQKHRIEFPDGEVIEYYNGAIDVRDLRLVHGYALTVVGYDRFGWSKGHPDSPLERTENKTD